MTRIKDAEKFAIRAHKGQKRYSGEPYHDHPFRVAEALSMLTNDEDVIIAGILHDTIEDTDVTYEQIEKGFGKRVADLVLEATHDEKGNYPHLNSIEGFAIKCVDRAHNLLTLQVIPDEHKEERKEMTERYKKNTKF